MGRAFGTAIFLLLTSACTKPATEAEISGCKEGCRSQLVCELNQAESMACEEACPSKIEDASSSCREALVAYGACAAGKQCRDFADGACNEETLAVETTCSGFAILPGQEIKPDSGGYSIPDGGIAGNPDATTNTGPGDAGFADPTTLLEGSEDLDGLRTYVKLMGTLTSTMPPLVFLHMGPALSHEYLLPHMKEFVEDRLLVFYDMRATGRSSFGTGGSTSTVTADQHALDVLRVLDLVEQYADTSKIDILGHGYGAAVGVLFASQFTERVSRLILVTPFAVKNEYYVDAFGESNRRLTTTDRRQIMAITNRPECLQNDSQCFLQVWTITGPKSMCQQNTEKFTDMSFLYGSFRAWVYVQNQLIDSNYDYTEQLRQITAKTTVISGLCDVVPHDSALTYAAEIPGAIHHELPDSGAFPFVETSTTFYRLVKSSLIYP